VRVLIAHRSHAARAALANAVVREGDEPLEFVASGDGTETLELLLQDEPPEVALVDWDMPGVDGTEICRLVRDFQTARATHVVLLAASAHTDTGEALQAGADDCVRTPAPAAAIRGCVEEGLRGARAKDARVDGAGPAATLEAVCAADADAGDFFGFGGAGSEPADDARPGAGSRLDAGPRLSAGSRLNAGSMLDADSWPDAGVRPAARARPADDESRPAVLEAVLHQV
jgi:CheY-like chemotaxis protein